MRFLRRSLVGLFLLAVTVGVLTYAGHIFVSAVQERLARESQEPPARERVFSVNVARLVAQDIAPVLTAYGEVRSRRTLDLRAKSSGTVIELAEAFEEGGVVRAGQLLVQVDPADAQAALDVARADLSEAQAELRDAQRTLELAHDELTAAEKQAQLRETALARQQDLRGRGVGTDAAVETAALAASAAAQVVLSQRQALATAETQAELTQTQLDRAKVALAEAERDLADTALYAEFDGVLADVTLVQGGLVANNEQVAQLIDPDQLEVSFRVSTSQYAHLLDASGALIPAPITATVDVFGTDLVAGGRIARESPAVGEGQTGRLLFARLQDAAGFRPGDFVTIAIEEPQMQQVARIPATALDANGTVLLIGADERLEQARVKVLRAQGDDVIIRAPGLYGREVVAERSPLLGAGIKVRPIRPQADAAGEVDAGMVALTPERRARLIAFVEGNARMPSEAKERLLLQLAQDEVPAQTISRLESRFGG
ncbi:efflux RND transporter periplasmic adaptor subunit [Actibacterium ureilyticum]|uniref:efflux RND transporter periplasmic adaptor subunit n=1 Tax=Actibacterium ureilyticum TaxID=1590614 RepID=UPI000BAB0E7D|nr:HlyD family efflux transporter periplasmic adaptor subunit [Actibacterium ureilyticum]